ncbi:MAG: YeeE/YedE family protein [Hyphomicrobium sp.]
MTDLKTFLAAHSANSLAAGGFLIGLAFGYLTQRANFCIMGSIANWVTIKDARGMRSWVLAAAIAIMAVAVLSYSGLLDINQSIYTTARLNWATHIIGGLMFGVGMVLAGGCASRNLVLAGTGDLRSGLTLLVTSLFAAMTIGGVLAPLRAGLENLTAFTLPMPSQRLTDMASAMGATESVSGLALPFLIALTLLVKCLSDEPFRTSRRHLAIGFGVGLLVTASWLLTGLAFDELADRVQPPVALSFVKPSADMFGWLERSTALGIPGFGVASVFGTFAGGALSAYLNRRLHLIAFADLADTLRHLAGAALMGFGGVMALGCSVGQGISGVSTLAIGSILAAGSIVAGNIAGLRLLQSEV